MEERTLSDGAVVLSPPTEADIDTITACCQHPSIGAWVTIPIPYRREHAEAFIEDGVRPGWANRSPTWALRPDKDGPVIGMISLEALDASAAEVGYWLVPEQRSRGLMSRALRMVCDYGFDPGTLGLQRINWRAFAGNRASAAVAARNGFRYEGMMRLGSVQRGARRDTWVAGRLSTDPGLPVMDWPV
ncbi:GNAT family N-acetyltransferase [Nocardia sp. XZ_19_385]|uniref:GNAT family N-acetyltransferase n=1 Tax=Nocardia sp. XZ_19_385 TaxID=2769488 RepID=UPI00188EB6F4|nr:GNAT family N-acetyltransferase [Nocardia sp. XZ_19_385]